MTPRPTCRSGSAFSRPGRYDPTRSSWRSFTPSIYLQSLTQYNNQSKSLSANVRFGWLGPAGTGLFVVFNEGRETGENARPLDRAFLVKFTRQLDLGK